MTAQSVNSPSWTQVPERSNRLMMRIMVWVSLRIGRRAARVILHVIAGYFLLFAPASRRASSDYLRRALSREPRWGDLYRHFFTFAATIHDRVYLANRRFELFDFEIHGQDTLDNLLASGQGVFLMGAHLGSFDVIRAIGRNHRDLPVAMVMHEGNARKINAILATLNPQAAQEIISLGHVDSMIKVSERLADGCAIGILADRGPGHDITQRVSFLGADANLPVGPFRMAALLRRPAVFMTGLYLGSNRYAIYFDSLADFSDVARDEREVAVAAAVNRYATLVEHYCRVAPYNWFNFFDFWQSTPVAKLTPL